MKVWMCKRTDDFGGFSGGLAVVAANSKEEAFKIFFEDMTYGWMVNKIDVETGDNFEDCTKWESDYYPLEKWFECKALTANVDKPCVIMEDGYTE
jgi:hypothetical protein